MAQLFRGMRSDLRLFAKTSAAADGQGSQNRILPLSLRASAVSRTTSWGGCTATSLKKAALNMLLRHPFHSKTRYREPERRFCIALHPGTVPTPVSRSPSSRKRGQWQNFFTRRPMLPEQACSTVTPRHSERLPIQGGSSCVGMGSRSLLGSRRPKGNGYDRQITSPIYMASLVTFLIIDWPLAGDCRAILLRSRQIGPPAFVRHPDFGSPVRSTCLCRRVLSYLPF